MIHNRDELAVAVGPDQKIYAIGGFGGPNKYIRFKPKLKQFYSCCLCSVERFDPEKNEWELIASLNTPRRALAAVTLPDGIYAIGGFDGFNYLNSVEKYIINNSIKIQLPDMMILLMNGYRLLTCQQPGALYQLLLVLIFRIYMFWEVLIMFH